MILEKTITKAILDYLRKDLKCWAFKVHGGPWQRAGIPDIVGVYHGRFFGLEVKVPGNEPTEIQTRTLKELAHHGAISGVVYSVKDVMALLLSGLAE